MARTSDRNLKAYNSRLTVLGYSRASGLQAPEATILRAFQHEIQGRRILDLGVGGGRTTPHLLDLSDRYIGLDNSERMIRACSARHPDASFRLGDARDLSTFSTASFDFVMFSFNGIDLLDHAGRLKVFAEVSRVLSEGGLFVFSSHNRAAEIRKAWDLRHLPFDVNPIRRPLRFAKRLFAYPVGVVNYALKSKSRYQVKNEEHCILYDGDGNYTVLVYYISILKQLPQISRYGFAPVGVFGLDGRQLRNAEHTSCNDPWIYYVCRRSSTPVRGSGSPDIPRQRH